MYQEFLDIGLQAVQAAEEVVMRYFRMGEEAMGFSLKHTDDRHPDFQQSPVTLADTLGEQTIKDTIKASFPDHGFIGEEEGIEKKDADHKRVIDPIDGTRNFSRGLPNRAIMLALEYRGEFLISIISSPISQEFFYAVKGRGCFYNDQQVTVSSRGMKEAYMLHQRDLYFQREGLDVQLDRLGSQIWYTKTGISWEYARVACGQVDVAVSCRGKYYDNAPIVLLVEEAGGRVTTLSGGAFSQEDTSMIASNGVFHDEVVSVFCA